MDNKNKKDMTMLNNIIKEIFVNFCCYLIMELFIYTLCTNMTFISLSVKHFLSVLNLAITLYNIFKLIMIDYIDKQLIIMKNFVMNHQNSILTLLMVGFVYFFLVYIDYTDTMNRIQIVTNKTGNPNIWIIILFIKGLFLYVFSF